MRLIDADELFNSLADYWGIPRDWDGRIDHTCEDALCAIENAPTIDAMDEKTHYETVYKLECLLCHATGGRYSKAGYSLETMERMVTDYIEELCEEAQEEAVQHGTWIGLEYDGYADGYPVYDLWECTECGEEVRGEDIPNTHLYCPNCGAKMDGGTANETD